jgi:3,4-dihydroxy 2-butanone 4-phosphate synthase/3,4-dihydroxy 2-butanone 4-phosphate synthase/GTP cyclohydrolase II
MFTGCIRGLGLVDRQGTAFHIPVDLAQATGTGVSAAERAAVCCEVMNRDGTMASAADLEVAALRWGMPLVEMPDLKTWL